MTLFVKIGSSPGISAARPTFAQQFGAARAFAQSGSANSLAPAEGELVGQMLSYCTLPNSTGRGALTIIRAAVDARANEIVNAESEEVLRREGVHNVYAELEEGVQDKIISQSSADQLMQAARLFGTTEKSSVPPMPGIARWTVPAVMVVSCLLAISWPFYMMAILHFNLSEEHFNRAFDLLSYGIAGVVGCGVSEWLWGRFPEKKS